jgi:GNAT superfamily N-acetyltransferase
MATMPDNRLLLRAMAPTDVRDVHALFHAEQWPHRKEDIAALLGLGAGTIAFMGGRVVASAMWWACGETAATLGMVIVERAHRRAGIGRLIMEAVLDQIGHRTVYLNTTEDGLPLYRKLGFVGVSEILQHQGAAFMAPLVPLDAGERIRPLGERDKTVATALFEAASGLPRAEVMSAVVRRGHGIVIDRAGEVTGFAIFRRWGRGYVIGPVVAPDVIRAKALIAQWLGSRSGEFTRLDIPGGCGLGGWLEELGIIRVDRVVTMVRGEQLPVQAPGQLFAITSQALL